MLTDEKMRQIRAEVMCAVLVPRWGSRELAKSMYIPQAHIREITAMEAEIAENTQEPFVVELWENGNYNEEGGELPDDD